MSESPAAIDLSPLAARLSGTALSPGDDGWDAGRQAWNLVADQRPAAVVLAGGVDDVRATVDFARERGLRVAPQSTGHAASGIASLDDTILLRTLQMNGVEVDAEARRARVEAGALWGAVGARAAEHGLVGVHGSAAEVGVVGLHARRRARLDQPPVRARRQQRARHRGRDRRRRARAGGPRERARPVLGAARRRRQLRRGDRDRVLALPADRGLRRNDRLAGRPRRRGDPGVCRVDARPAGRDDRLGALPHPPAAPGGAGAAARATRSWT